jgi:hypothetical protein
MEKGADRKTRKKKTNKTITTTKKNILTPNNDKTKINI